MVKNSQKSLIYCLILLSLPLTGGGLDIFAAGLPYIVKYYHTTQFLGQMSVTFYLLGLAIGSVIFGVVSDYCPYRPLFFVGCLIFSVISFLICMTTSIQLFLACRLVQGLAVSAPAVVTKGYLGKLFSGHELSRKSAGMSIA